MDEVRFLDDELTQDAVIRNFEVIGEASHNIETHYPEFAEQHPELPLSFAYQMRNAVSHGYFKVDYEIVWMTIQTKLAPFYSQIKTLAEQLANAQYDNHSVKTDKLSHPSGR